MNTDHMVFLQNDDDYHRSYDAGWGLVHLLDELVHQAGVAVPGALLSSHHVSLCLGITSLRPNWVHRCHHHGVYHYYHCRRIIVILS